MNKYICKFMENKKENRVNSKQWQEPKQKSKKEEKKDYSVQRLKEKYGEFTKKNFYKRNDGSEELVYIKGYNETKNPLEIYVFRNGNKKKEIIGVNELEEILKNHSNELTGLSEKNKNFLEQKDVDALLNEAEEVYEKKEENKIIKNMKDIELAKAKKEERGENKQIGKKENQQKGKELVKVVNEKELKKMVAQAREEYAKKDYVTTNVFTKIKRILGGNLKTKIESLSDVEEGKKQYNQALKELLSFQIKELKSKGLSKKEIDIEIDKLTRYYYQEERINLYEAHTKARAEAWEEKMGRKSGQLIKQSNQFVDWYRKLNWKKKIGLSVATTLSGAGFLMVGQRILGGVAAGVGTTAGLEAWQQKKEEKKSNAEIEEIKDVVDMEDEAEGKYQLLMESLENKIADYGDELQDEKTKARNRKIIGASIAIFIGSGAASELIHWGVDKVENTEVIKTAKTFWVNLYNQHFGHVTVGVGDHASKIPDYHHNHSVDTAKINHASKIPDYHHNHSVDTAKSVPASYLIEAQKGDSVWKMAGKQLEAHYGKTFDNLNPAQKTYVIDALKDKIAQNPAEFGLKNINKIKIGQKIDFSTLLKNNESVSKIFEHARHLSAAQLKNITHNNKTILDWANNHHGQALTSAKVEDILHQNGEITKKAGAGVMNGHAINQTSSSGHMNASDAYAKHTSDGITKHVTEKPAGLYMGKAGPVSEAGLAGGAMAMGGAKIVKNKLEKNKGTSAEEKIRAKISKKYKLSQEDNFSSRAKKIIQKVSLKSPENWRIMKDVKISELEKSQLSVKLVRNVQALEKETISWLGKEAKAKKRETLKSWLARIVNESLE